MVDIYLHTFPNPKELISYWRYFLESGHEWPKSPKKAPHTDLMVKYLIKLFLWLLFFQLNKHALNILYWLKIISTSLFIWMCMIMNWQRFIIHCNSNAIFSPYSFHGTSNPSAISLLICPPCLTAKGDRFYMTMMVMIWMAPFECLIYREPEPTTLDAFIPPNRLFGVLLWQFRDQESVTQSS